MRFLPTALLTASLLASSADAQLVEAPLPGVDWAQNLGADLPRDARFTLSDGTDVAFGDLFTDKPVVLALVYYECPMLCNLVLTGLVGSMKGMSLTASEEYDVIVLSIDPGESVELAAEQKAGWVERYGRGTADGWHFLVGDETNIARVADAVGFEYSYVPSTDEYAHSAGIGVLTPEARLARILYGIEFAPRDLKFSLMEASGGNVGSPIEKLILRCFSYDPTHGKYGFAILSTLRGLSIATVVGLLLFVFTAVRRERQRVPEAA